MTRQRPKKLVLVKQSVRTLELDDGKRNDGRVHIDREQAPPVC